ncbi:TIGR03086 family metal-binding protein [Catelliglobosispora koreensis]|uniref:TIGR03086 family metal-binding protein n=1 Tax=Catelliglobosispora koreensis TaxID=129052 RepID=UPI000375BCBE|nr:TIGR03086 family metal-binding protein [Catelliglobosispora koreensis]
MTFTVLTTALEALDRVTIAAVDSGQLNEPTPCTDWTVAQVLFHAAGDQHAWASVVGSGNMPAYDPFNPPHELDEGVAVTVTKAIQAATASWAGVDPAAASVHTPLPPVPVMEPELAAAACALDAAVHAWDVAVATGQPSPLTAELAEQLMPAARATADPLRGFAYAAALPSQPGEDAAEALLRYLGRDPHWS